MKKCYTALAFAASLVLGVSSGYVLADETESVSSAEYAAEENVTQVTLEDAARLNGLSVEDLNVVTDEEGYVKFLGNKFTDTVVTDEEEALAVLKSVAELAGTGDCNLDFYRVDDSTATGLNYYTFYQTDTAVIDGETVPAKYYGNLIKLITDGDGVVQGFSAYLNHNGTKTGGELDFLSASEAEEVVRVQTEGEAYIYSDYTTFYYWDDEDTVPGEGSKVVPVWAVYTESEDSTSSAKPYTIYLV